MKTGTLQVVDSAKISWLKGANSASIQAPTSFTNSYLVTLPTDLPGSTQALTISPTGQIAYASLSGSGSVTSVALTLPSIFSVAGSPITTSGTIAATLVSQSSNTFFAAPNGSAGAPTFRTIAFTDVINLGGTTGSSFALGNDSRFHGQNTDTGTTATSFQIDSGNSGFRIKNTSGIAEFRTSDNNGYADIRVANLFVTGTTTTVNSETVTIDDNVIVLNNNVTTGTPTEDLGIEGRRGGSASASLKFFESNSRWNAGLAGSELPLKRVYETTFTNTNLVSGILTVNHNLGRRVVNILLADNNNKMIAFCDDITFTSISSSTIDLTSFGTIAGSWTVHVSG